jgi:GNAT superfamily N-acetyltransferase
MMEMAAVGSAEVGERLGMDRQIAERIRHGWRAELGAPSAFRGPGRHVHLQPAQDPAEPGWVRVVALGDSACVSLPPSASARLRDLQQRDLDADLADPATVARVIGRVEEVVGPATLAFLDPTAVDVEHDPRVTLVPAGHRSVRQLVAACGPLDAEESGIVDVESTLAVCQVAGQVVAASGYRVWHGQLGHLSVLVDPAFRGRGLGKTVAARAVDEVVHAGLIPQWRARSTLVASRQIARSLGFVELGRQANYRLASPT